ncbi:MAG: AbrB/MazE/SpoVT family DNA-binding domain-containing protein [Verrucomicrobia bacterium]|nr:AbrB/MazE/SpoVT family DNA-binding domain-containing protein [Verrucomicrobiota bacterium]
MITTLTVTSKRQLVLPKEFCKRAGIAPGSQLRVAAVRDGLYLSPIPAPTEDELRAVIRAAGGPTVREPKDGAGKIKRAIQAVRRRA